MREFGFNFDELLSLPLKRFWFLVNQIDRLRAEEGIRHIQLLASAQDGDAIKEVLESLKDEMGKVFIWQEDDTPKEIRIDAKTGLDPEFDRAGLRSLAALSELREGQMV